MKLYRLHFRKIYEDLSHYPSSDGNVTISYPSFVWSSIYSK